jgi:hypothetical protein
MRRSIRLGLLILACHLILAAGEPVFHPWLPQKLDDWVALQAEAKAYVAYLEHDFPTLPAIRARIETGEMHMSGLFSGPPEGTLPKDRIGMSYRIEYGNWRSSVGETVLWRATDGNVAAAQVGISIADVAKVMPTVVGDIASSMRELDAWAAAARPPGGVWVVGTYRDVSWLATWRRQGVRAATRDDAEGKAPDVRKDDMRWLNRPATPLRATVAKPIPAKDYAARIKAHSGVQQALARYHAGWTPRSITILEVRPNMTGIEAGIAANDTLIAIDGHPVASWHDLDQLGTDAPHTVELTHMGAKPRTVRLPVGERGIAAITSTPEPALAVLAANGATSEVVVGDVLTAMCALDQPELAATAAGRLTGKLQAPALAFVHAWIASARDDFGRADALLAACKTNHAALGYEVEQLQASNRQRSGRFFWAWPERASEVPLQLVLRHLMRDLASEECFPVFDGIIDGKRFSVESKDRIQPEEQAAQLVSEGGGRLAAVGERLYAEAVFANLPDRVLFSANFTLETVPGTTRSDPDAGLRINFQRRSPKLITSRGCGSCSITADGRVCAIPATLDERDDFTSWQTVPIAVTADGSTPNTLRIIRVGQLQRIEINGRAAVQGFLPLTADDQTRYAVAFQARRDLVIGFTNMRWSTTTKSEKPSDF